MRIINSLIVPKIVKGGLLGFFNIHSVAKHQKQYERGAFEDFKKFRKKVSQSQKRAGKCHRANKWKTGPILGFAFQGKGLWMRSKSSTEYFW